MRPDAARQNRAQHRDRAGPLGARSSPATHCDTAGLARAATEPRGTGTARCPHPHGCVDLAMALDVPRELPLAFADG